MPENPQVSSRAVLSLENSDKYNKRRFKNNTYALGQLITDDAAFQQFSKALDDINPVEKVKLRAALNPADNDPFKFESEQLLLLQQLFSNLLNLGNKKIGLLLTQDELKAVLTALSPDVRENLLSDDSNKSADARARLLLDMMVATEENYLKLKQSNTESQTRVEHEKYLASLKKIIDDSEEPSSITRKTVVDALNTVDPDDDEKLSPLERVTKKLRLKEMFDNEDGQFFMRNEWVRTPGNVSALGKEPKWGTLKLGDRSCMALKVQENYVRRGVSGQESSFLLIDIQNAPFSLAELRQLVRDSVTNPKIPKQNSPLLVAAVGKENPFSAIQFVDKNGKRYALYADIIGADSFYFQKIELEGDATSGYKPKYVDNSPVLSYLNADDLKSKVDTQAKPYEGLTIAQAVPLAIKRMATACDFYAISDQPMPEDVQPKTVLVETAAPASVYEQPGLFLLFDDSDVRLQELIFNGDFTAKELLGFFMKPGGLSEENAIGLFKALGLSGVDLAKNTTLASFTYSGNKLNDNQNDVTVFAAANFDNLTPEQRKRFDQLFTPENRKTIQEIHKKKVAERNEPKNAAVKANYDTAFNLNHDLYIKQKQGRDIVASYQADDKKSMLAVGFRVKTYFGLLQQAAEADQTAKDFWHALQQEAGLQPDQTAAALEAVPAYRLQSTEKKPLRGTSYESLLSGPNATAKTQMRCILTSLKVEIEEQRAKQPGQSSFFAVELKAIERMLKKLDEHTAAVAEATSLGEQAPTPLTFAVLKSELTAELYAGAHHDRNTLFFKRAAEGKLDTEKNDENLHALTNAFMLTGTGETAILEVGFVPNNSGAADSAMNLLKIGIESCLQDHQGKISIRKDNAPQEDLTLEYHGIGAFGNALYLFKKRDEKSVDADDTVMQAAIQNRLIEMGKQALRKRGNVAVNAPDHTVNSVAQCVVLTVEAGKAQSRKVYPDPAAGTAASANASAVSTKPSTTPKK